MQYARWHLRLLLPVAAILVALLPFAVPASAQPQQKSQNGPKRVLLLHSFGRDFKPWSEYGKAIRTELDRQSPWPIDLIEHSLVSARFGEEDPEKPLADYLQALFAKHAPDLIVSIGAPAAAFIQRHRPRLFADTPMVFTAVEQRRVQFSNLTANDAVVAARIDYLAAFENILRVLPDTKNITVVVGTSPIETFWREAIAKEVAPVAGRVTLSWTDQWSFEQLLQNAANMPPQSAIFWELMIVDAAGVVHEGNAALAKLHAVSKAPIFSYDESFFSGETVGGPFLRVADTSRQTASIAVRILNGDKPGDIKVAPVEFGRPMYDWRALQRWGIPESRLPADREIHFREPSMWEKYRTYIVLIALAFLMQGALITWLIYEHWWRQMAEARSAQRMTEIARLNRYATAGALSASIAHEIRQPLTAISASGSAGLNWLGHKVPNLERARAAFEEIVSASYRADNVLKGVRAMFRNEPTEHVPVDVNEIVRQVLVLVERPIRSNGITVTTALADGRSTLVMADPVQLQQVVLNLIMNAIEAMAASSLQPKTLRIETRIDQAGEVLLLVQDSGPGFDAEVGNNLFKPFVTTKTSGMGMGLSICKSIIEQHDGTLTADSVEPHGAVFRISLPAAP